jgi:N-acyl homoserine lactone hydrolase
MSKTTATNVTRLYVLDFGLFQVHENGRIIGIPGFLIQTKDRRNILVDTGFPAWYADDPHGSTLNDRLDTFGRVLRLTHDNLPAAQLAQAGLTTADITDLVLTHSDIDHVGGIADFPQAPIIMGRAERELPQPRYFEDISPIAWPINSQYHLIDRDTELCPSLTLLATPGHSPGHLSLLAQLPRTGPVLLTGDAISRPAELKEGFGGAWDEAQARASAERLMKIAQEQNAWIIYGHDPAQWPALAKAPAYYD